MSIALAAPAMSGVSWDDMDRCIRDGFPMEERERRDRAIKALDFFKANFRPYPVRPVGISADPERYCRTTPVMQRALNALTKLYKKGPKRILTDHPQASEWLNDLYRRNTMDSLWQESDALAGCSDVALFQAVTTPDPRRPLKIRLWDASQFHVWLEPEDQTCIYAIAIRDQYNSQKRIRLWTPETITTYLTKSYSKDQTSGGTAFKQVDQVDNELEFLPFSCVHWKQPSCDFWAGSPGDVLVEINDCANFGLTNGFDNIRYNLDPILLLKNVQLGWTPPKAAPGNVWNPPGRGGENNAQTEGDAQYLQTDPSYVVASWEDLDHFIDLSMAMHNIPPAAVRMVQQSARSGASIIAEQIDLIDWAEGRQRPFAHYEDELATMVMRVGAKHYGSSDNVKHPEYAATSAQLQEAADNLSLQLRWSQMYPSIPGEERDRSDQWEMEARITSPVQVVMRREGMTREEAEAHLEEVAKDFALMQSLFADVIETETEQALAASGKAVDGEPTKDESTEVAKDEAETE